MSIEDTSESVDMSHPAANRAHSHTPREAGVGIGDIACRLLVASVYNPQFTPCGSGQDRIQPIATQHGHKWYTSRLKLSN